MKCQKIRGDSRRTQTLLTLVDETIRSVRRIATELRPGMLDDLGLVATIEWAGEEFGARIKGSRKSTPYAAQVAAEDAGKKAMEHGMKILEVEVFDGSGLGPQSRRCARCRRSASRLPRSAM